MTILDQFFSDLQNIFSSKSNDFKIFLEHEFSRMPQKAHATDAGWDISSCEHKTIPPKQWLAVDTGIKMVIPEGWEIQIRPRSGLALKKGIMVLNSPGTIDCEYRNRIKVILYNGGEYPFDIHPGDRIAQAVMSPVFNVTLSQIEEMPEEKTSRDQGGFGSSGS
jgi:dUTP pyrophosphatase